jgi:hypothetical protein
MQVLALALALTPVLVRALMVALLESELPE